MFRQSLLICGMIAAAFANDDFCAFYADKDCTAQVGSVDYSVQNSGCIQNTGTYLKCHGGAEASGSYFKIVQSPSNDGGCGCQSDCIEFKHDFSTRDPYVYCIPLNLDFAYTDYRLITGANDESGYLCGANNC